MANFAGYVVHVKNFTDIRLVGLALVLPVQILLVSLNYDAYQSSLLESGQWFSFVSYSGQFAKVLIAVIVFSLLGLFPRLRDHYAAITRLNRDYRYHYPVLLQLICFAVFLYCTHSIFGRDAGQTGLSNGLVLSWLAALSATGILWMLSLAPPSYWSNLLKSEAKVFAAAFIVGTIAWLLSRFAQTLWTPMSDWTFYLSSKLLGLIYADIYINPETKIIGVDEFFVNIAPECSGYEGIGLMVVFTAFYLSIFRKDFRFPQSFLLFPIGMAAIWLFNAVRIAALISLGASFSPEVAVGGFHSQAGWISFILVIIATLMLAYRSSFFCTGQGIVRTTGGRINLPMALLIPAIVLLASTILTSAFSGNFDWLYPLRVVAVALALVFCWRLYEITDFRLRLEPVLAGFAVFVIWVLLVPGDPVKNTFFEENLFQAPGFAAAAWLLLRAIGAVVTVPIAEELLFRGYLITRLARTDIVLEGKIPFSWLALLASSVTFGLLHANWLAGIIAGIVYGIVRYRGRSIVDAIVAHAGTNLFLTIYVLLAADWSLW